MDRVLNLIPRRVLLASIFMFLSFAEAYGQTDVKIKNTAKQIKPGIYECIIYLDISKELIRCLPAMPTASREQDKHGQE